MKVMVFNGAPKPKGTTAYALSLVEEELNAAGIETVTVQVGTKPVAGCIACNSCSKTGECVFADDGVNEAAKLAEECDGFVFGAPTYYFSAAGQARSFLDRLYYSAGSKLRFKPCAVLSVARRAGTVTAVDDLLKYPMINQQPVVSTCYIPVAFGSNAEQMQQDEEGIRIMRTLGRNMAWMLKSIEAGREAGVQIPEELPRAMTNFIR